MQELDKYEHKQHRGRPQKYDWNAWLSPGTRRIQQGIDFEASIGSMENLIRKTASRKKVKLSVYRETATNSLVLVVKKENDEDPVSVNPPVDSPTMEGT